MGQMQEPIAIKHNVVKFSFSEANLAASQTNTDIPVLGADHTDYLLPFDGFIVGYAIRKSAAHGAGSLDFDINISGTSTLTIAADTTEVYASLNVPDEPFSAGAYLGVDYTSDENLSATTVDVVIDIYVLFRDMNF